MKLLIVGSRSITDFDLSPYIPDDIDTVISGGACGIDSLAEQYADSHCLSKYIVRPRYDLYGRAAPLKRSEQMVDMADAVLVIWDGCSKGTQHTLKYAKKRTSRLRLFHPDSTGCAPRCPNCNPSSEATAIKSNLSPIAAMTKTTKWHVRQAVSISTFLYNENHATVAWF